MATVNIYSAYNMDTPLEIGDGVRPLATDTEMILTDGFLAAYLHGAGFTYDVGGNLSGGTADYVAMGDATFGTAIIDMTGSLAMGTSVYDTGYTAGSQGTFYGFKAEQALWLSGNDTVNGSAYGDVLNGYEANDKIYGLGGDDRLHGGDGADSLDGGVGNDVLTGGAGNDTLVGGTGRSDMANFSDLAPSPVTGYKMLVTGNLNAGSIALQTGSGVAISTETVSGIEEVRGSGNQDYISTGTAGYQDGVQGLFGNDTVIGAAGDHDYIDYRYLGAASHVVVDLTDTSSTTTFATGQTFLSTSLSAYEVDSLRNINGVIGSAGADIMTGSAGDDWFRGMAGNDTVDGAAQDSTGDWIDYHNTSNVVNVTLSAGGVSQTIDAGAFGIDTVSNVENIAGSDYAETLMGNEFSNSLRGNGGNDTLNGGAGAETDYVDYKVASSGVTVTWNNTTNTAVSAGGDGADSITNIEGVRGGDYGDTFVAGAYSSYFDGRGGVDLVSYAPNGAGVTINLALTTAQTNGDTLLRIEKVTGSNYNDTLSGNTANNTLSGGVGNDAINGNAGNDVINGGTGNDAINGSIGNDNLTGGTGLDAFIFNTALNATTNLDIITDFVVADDTIRLENAIFTALSTTGTLAADNFVIGSAALDTNDYVVYNSTTGALSYDADGSGAAAAVQIATLGAGLALTNADFVVI